MSDRDELLPRKAETIGPTVRFTWTPDEAEEPARGAARTPQGVALAIPTPYTPRTEAETMLRALEEAEAALAARVERANATAQERHTDDRRGQEWRIRVLRAGALGAALGELREVVRRAKVESGLLSAAEVYGPPSAHGLWLFWSDGTPDREAL